MKTNLRIDNVETKVGKSGKPFDLIKTNEGNMTCFHDKTSANLRANIGKLVEVEVNERNGFKGIIGFYGLSAETVKINASVAPYAVSKPYEAGNSRMASVILSYVKDMVVAGKVEVKDIGMVATALMAIHADLSK